jgi:uracil-DNA glycosylase
MDRKAEKIETLVREISGCKFCQTGELPNFEGLGDVALKEPVLSHTPRPVFQFSSTAKICIAGQAPGNLAHQSGRPFTDPSGVRLREWLGVSEAQFYDPDCFAIVPMGFCFPGYVNHEKRSDKPPRKECAALWRKAIFDAHPQLELILVIGQYAQAWHLGSKKQKTLTETVKHWRDYQNQSLMGIPNIIPLPHPSWRNSAWLKKNPWFEVEILPYLRGKIMQIIGS